MKNDTKNAASETVTLTRDELTEMYEQLRDYRDLLAGLRVPLQLDIAWEKRYLFPVRDLLKRLLRYFT